jgi:hypothetical protein
LIKKRYKKNLLLYFLPFQFLVIKTLDPEPGPDSLEMLDPDPYPKLWIKDPDRLQFQIMAGSVSNETRCLWIVEVFVEFEPQGSLCPAGNGYLGAGGASAT